MENYAEIFTKFLEQLSEWSTTGKEPPLANQDMKYYLDLQEARLKSHNVQLKIQYDPEYKVTSTYRYAQKLPGMKHFMRFNYNTYFQGVSRKYVYSINGKLTKRYNDYVAVYQTIVDGDDSLADTDYVCPNCGSISKLHVLQEEGCPYCNTRYIMDDLYPKVINYYSINTGAISNKGFQNTIQTMLLIAIVLSGFIALDQFIVSTEYTFFFRVIVAVFSGLLGFPLFYFILYIGYTFIKLFGLIGKTIDMIPVASGSKGTKKKIDQYLKKYDPSFDYEYFEGKALSLARIVMLSDNLEHATQYEGLALPDSFKDVIDVQYLGGFGLQNYHEEGDEIVLHLRLYLETTLFRKGKIKKDRTPVLIEMTHNTKFPVDAGFSIMKVQCPNCGASFDARNIKYCPYCNSKYNIIDHDWLVRRISQ